MASKKNDWLFISFELTIVKKFIGKPFCREPINPVNEGLKKAFAPRQYDLRRFYRVNLAERIGSGIKRMGDLMRDHGLGKPKIEVTEGFFTIIFHVSWMEWESAPCRCSWGIAA